MLVRLTRTAAHRHKNKESQKIISKAIRTCKSICSVKNFEKMAEFIKSNQKVLFVWGGAAGDALETQVNQLKGDDSVKISVENIERLEVADYANSSFDVVLSNWPGNLQEAHTAPVLALYLKLVKPNGLVALKDTADKPLESELKLSGFVNVRQEHGAFVGTKPNYEVGSGAKLSFSKKVWKLDDDDEELINADDLLDEEDKKVPDPSSLRVCGTTGKRKACKDCSCGLAEELEGEKRGAASNQIQKSSCGSVRTYLPILSSS